MALHPLPGCRLQSGIKTAVDPLCRLAVVSRRGAIGSAALPAGGPRPGQRHRGGAQHYLLQTAPRLPMLCSSPALLGAICLLGTLAGDARAIIGQPAPWPSACPCGHCCRCALLHWQRHTAVVSPAADAERAAGGGRCVRLRQAVQALGEAGCAVSFRGAASGWRRDRVQQDIPDVLRPDLTIAYTTDGYGQRGDARPAPRSTGCIDAPKSLSQQAHVGIVLTADYSFLSYYPYWELSGG